MTTGLSGCQNYGHQLQRGQGYYERNEYEMALAVFRHLESDQGALTSNELVRYAYLRGMTDFRLGYHQDARYWLGLASANQERAQSALAGDESQRLAQTLASLHAPIYGIADESLTSALGSKDEN